MPQSYRHQRTVSDSLWFSGVGGCQNVPDNFGKLSNLQEVFHACFTYPTTPYLAEHSSKIFGFVRPPQEHAKSACITFSDVKGPSQQACTLAWLTDCRSDPVRMRREIISETLTKPLPCLWLEVGKGSGSPRTTYPRSSSETFCHARTS